jgi:hypothetical protein
MGALAKIGPRAELLLRKLNHAVQVAEESYRKLRDRL